MIAPSRTCKPLQVSMNICDHFYDVFYAYLLARTYSVRPLHFLLRIPHCYRSSQIFMDGCSQGSASSGRCNQFTGKATINHPKNDEKWILEITSKCKNWLNFFWCLSLGERRRTGRPWPRVDHRNGPPTSPVDKRHLERQRGPGLLGEESRVSHHWLSLIVSIHRTNSSRPHMGWVWGQSSLYCPVAFGNWHKSLLFS